VQEQWAGEAEEKSRLTNRVEEMTTTVDQLTTELEEKREQAENATAELQQAKLTLDVSIDLQDFSPPALRMFTIHSFVYWCKI